jgi:Copper binding periplasmic protein CusF
MRMWRVALLVNLALAVGLAVGYGAWGRRVSSLEGEVEAARAQIERLAREREARHAGGRFGEQLWEGRGVVRAVYPRLLIVTHEDIPGLLPARTTGFRLADTVDRGRTRAGDSVRFWLRGAGQDNPTLVRIEAW